MRNNDGINSGISDVFSPVAAAIVENELSINNSLFQNKDHLVRA
jgi:hypothetical protein